MSIAIETKIKKTLIENALDMIHSKYLLLNKLTNDDYTCIISLQPVTDKNNNNCQHFDDNITVVFKMLSASTPQVMTIATSVKKLNNTPQSKNIPDNKQFVHVYKHLQRFVTSNGPTDTTQYNSSLYSDWIEQKNDNILIHHVTANGAGINEKGQKSLYDIIDGFTKLYPNRIWRWLLFKKFGQTLYELETTDSYILPVITIDHPE